MMVEQDAPNQEQTEQQPEGAQAAPSFLDNFYPSDTPSTESQEVEESTEEEQEETTSETESETDDTSEGDEEVISSLSQLVESQEWDPEWVNNLEVDVKVDGKPAKATMKDLVSSYQMQEAAQHRLDEAKSKAQATNQELAQQSESLRADLGAAAGLVQLAEQLFQQDISEANLAKLREEDEQAYLVAKDRFVERRNALEQVKQQLRDNVQKAFQQQQPDEQQVQEVLKTERAALIEKAPDLKEQKARDQLASYIVSQGFAPEEVGEVMDHRQFLLARKAMLYDQSQAKVETAKKKVAKIPKVMKPGAAQQKAPEKPKDAASILYG